MPATSQEQSALEQKINSLAESLTRNSQALSRVASNVSMHYDECDARLNRLDSRVNTLIPPTTFLTEIRMNEHLAAIEQRLLTIEERFAQRGQNQDVPVHASQITLVKEDSTTTLVEPDMQHTGLLTSQLIAIQLRLDNLESKWEQPDKKLHGENTDLQRPARPTDDPKDGDIGVDARPEQAESTPKYGNTVSRERRAMGYGAYSLSPSCWDASLLCNGRIVGYGNCAVTLIAILLNVLCQVLLCWIVNESLNQKVYSNDMEPWKAWRDQDAHGNQFYNWFSDKSLATRVCVADPSLSVAAGQVQAITDFQAYTQLILGVPGGILTSGVCTLVWFVTSFSEIRSTLYFVSAIWVLRGPGHTKLGADEGHIEVVSISYVKLGFVFIIAALRMLIAWSLLVTGAFWLARTPGISDLVLNVTALGFIIEVDELFFSAIAPKTVQTFLEAMLPLTLPVGEHQRIPIYSVMSLVCCAICSVYIGLEEQIPLYNNIVEMERELCSGQKNFVVVTQSVTLQPYLTRTSKDKTISPLHLPAIATVQEVVRETRKDRNWQLKYSTYAESYSPAFLRAEAFLNMEDLSRYWPGCADYSASDASIAVISAQTGIKGNSCGDFAEACGRPNATLLRYACQETCKCGYPRGAPFLGGPAFGCNREDCATNYDVMQARGELACEDPSPEALRNDSGWKQYWHSFWEFIVDTNEADSVVGMDVNKIIDQGCAVIASISLYVCAGDYKISSIAGYCPKTCKCKEVYGSPCPLACEGSDMENQEDEE